MNRLDLCPTCQSLFAFLADPSTTIRTVTYDHFAVHCKVCIQFSRPCISRTRPLPVRVSLSANLQRSSGTIHITPLRLKEAGAVTHEFPMHLKECRIIDTGVPLPENIQRDHYGYSLIAVIPRGMLPAHTGADKCLVTIEQWLRSCIGQHRCCNRILSIAGSRAAPTRLIHIGYNNQLRLIETYGQDSGQQPTKYATLSYRWSQRNDTKLLRSKIDDWQNAIDFTQLPVLFQDSIYTAKRLGIMYVWIDAMCIIQDDRDDWLRESVLMGQVYQNAYCNFAATAAASGYIDGLFTMRDPYRYTPPVLRSAVASGSRSYVLYHQYSTGELYSEPLLRRGWIFQERLMSPRTIYFGRQITWECADLLACEAFPSGWGPTCWSGAPLNFDAPVRMTTMLHRSIIRGPGIPTTIPVTRQELHYKWLWMVQEFKRCRLTYDTDALPAMSGLAKIINEELQDQYFAGVWRGNLVPSLFWRPWRRSSYEQQSTGEYIAPSWSWASAPASIFFPFSLGNVVSSKEVYIGKVHEVAVTLVGADPMGQVSAGFIRISGYMKETHVRTISRNDELSGAQLGDYHSDWGDANESREIGKTVHIAICYELPSNESHVLKALGRIRGLIIEPTGTAPHEYRRVGMFNHPWGKISEYPDVLDAKDFPEFEGFSPHDVELTTVTVI